MIKFSLYREIPDQLGRRVPIEELYEMIDKKGIVKIYGYYQIYINKNTGERYTLDSSPDSDTFSSREAIDSFIYGIEGSRRSSQYTRVVCFLRKSRIQELKKENVMIPRDKIDFLRMKGLIKDETSKYYTEIYD